MNDDYFKQIAVPIMELFHQKVSEMLKDNESTLTYSDIALSILNSAIAITNVHFLVMKQILDMDNQKFNLLSDLFLKKTKIDLIEMNKEKTD